MDSLASAIRGGGTIAEASQISSALPTYVQEHTDSPRRPCADFGGFVSDYIFRRAPARRSDHPVPDEARESVIVERLDALHGLQDGATGTPRSTMSTGDPPWTLWISALRLFFGF